MIIIGTPVVVVLFIDGLEVLGLPTDKLAPGDGIWRRVEMLDGNLDGTGLVVAGLFVAYWASPVLNYC